MNLTNPVPDSPRSVGRRFASVTLLALGIALAPSVPVTADRLPDPQGAAPLVRILTPHDGFEVNAAALRVRALVAAVQLAPGQQFSFDGTTIAGRNAGQISSVALFVDGITVATLDTSRSGPQVVASFEFDMTSLSAGAHQVAVTAVGKQAGRETTEQLTVMLDPALPPAETNRVEEAATPEPFQGFEVHGAVPFSSARFALTGRITLGALSDGLNLTNDRIVVALGTETVVFEPADLACRGQVCRARGRGFLDALKLERGRDARWQFHLGGTRGPGSGMLFVRIGNDWGGFDLRTGARLARLPEVVDADHRATGWVGDAGGTVQTLDASGVLIRLDVPPGALVRDTLISVTPLTMSPLAGAPQALHPGVKLEPEGLRFMQPATLTFDFSATNLDITAEHTTFLLTSPMTTLPLSTVVDPVAKTLTTPLHHFSTPQPGPAIPAYIDLKAWADPILASTGTISLQEVETLLALSAQQQRQNCTQNCVDLGALARRLSASIAALVSAECILDVGNPTDRALERYLQLDALGQQLGADTTPIRPCLEGILRELIVRAGAVAVANPSPANLARLVSLAARAQGLAFDSLQTQALRSLDDAMRELARRVLAGVAAARGTPSEAAVLSQARADLELLVTYVDGPGSVVLRVDPGLPAYLRTALASLSAARLEAVVLGQRQNNWRSVVQSLCSARLSEDNPVCPELTNVVVLVNRAVPLTLSTSAFTMAMAQPEPSVVTVDATVAAPLGNQGVVTIGFRFPQPGSLAVELNPSWQTSPAGGSCFEFHVYGPEYRELYPEEVWDEVVVIQAASGAPFSCPGGIDTVNRPYPFGNLAGNGRVATIRFIPR